GRGEAGAEERTLVPSSASGSAETLPGSALGTPAYMSPEQARGDLETLGPRSDVYSLGGTLYCLLARPAPFEGDDVGPLLRAPPRRAGGRPPAAAVDRPVERQGAGGGLPEGDGAGAVGSLRPPQGAGRGRRAVDGRRAGLGLEGAARPAVPPRGAAASDGGGG